MEMIFRSFIKNNYDNSGIFDIMNISVKTLLNDPVFAATVIHEKLHQGIHVFMISATNQAAAITLLDKQPGVDQFGYMM